VFPNLSGKSSIISLEVASLLGWLHLNCHLSVGIWLSADFKGSHNWNRSAFPLLSNLSIARSAVRISLFYRLLWQGSMLHWIIRQELN
jgi:hypothetical protein